MTIEDAKRIHTLIADDRWVDAGNDVLRMLGKPPSCASAVQAVKICQGLFQYLLDSDKYLEAATLQWGPEMFNTEPESTVRVFKALESDSRVLLQGASSMSKTYAAGGYYLLDYLRDPLYTGVKLAAINEDHLKKNLFAHVVTLFRNCAIPSPHKIIVQDSALWMGIKEAGNEFGISGIAFKQSQETSGQFKGYKPKPVRKKAHPKFGFMSRLRVLGDEGQNWPNGPFKDFNSLVASITGTDIVKITVAYNPESIGQHVVQLAEPEQGWRIEELDSLYDWISKAGWRVCRLDAAQCENVLQRRVVYPGLQTYEGYLSYLKAGGDNSPNYLCVDSKTEVLSTRGWIKHYDVGPGERIYTVNTESGMSEWCQVAGVYSKLVDREMISMEGRSFSALVTEDHNWATTHKGRIKKGRRGLTLKQTSELREHDLIPLARPPGEFGSDCGHFAELVGWVISDGTFQPLGNGTKVCVNQSATANPEKCERIRCLLIALGANHWEQECNGIKFFNFSGPLALKVRDAVGPKKRLLPEFIMSLSYSSRHRLMRGLLLGDGGHLGWSKSRPVGNECFHTSREADASAFSMLAATLGIPTTTRKNWQVTEYAPDGMWMWIVVLRKSRYARKQNIKVERVRYSGVVWCPRTKNLTFLARRNGTTYLTGNCFGRGFPPVGGSVEVVIPPSWPQEARGEAVFIETPVNIAAVDLAFMGKDSAQMAVGRWGLASGYRDQFGKFQTFSDRNNVTKSKPRHVLQCDQILPLEKHDNTVQMAEEIMGRCKVLGIRPEWVAVDKTGYGFGVHSHLFKVWGDVLGVAWNEKATERKIIADDTDGADKQCDGVMSEMWWALRKWLEPRCRALLINPIIPPNPLQTQLTTRRYKAGTSKGVKVEKKEEYMARNAKNSPDEADALVMLVHLVRSRSDVLPGIVEEQSSRPENGGSSLRFISVKQMVPADTHDSICPDGVSEF